MKRVNAVRVGAMLAVATATQLGAEPQRGNDDYPPEALHKHQQGAVVVDVSVGPDGRVTGCSVVVSSKSPELDDATCKIFLTRAKFIPARDADGRPVPDHTLRRIDWVIPGCKLLPQADPRLATVQASVTITALQGC